MFSSPTDGETDVAVAGAIRIQFSRGLNEPSLAGRLRVSYVGAPRQPDAGLPFQTTYDGANRAVVLRMAQPLEAFRTVKVEILDGLKGVRRRAGHAVDDLVLRRRMKSSGRSGGRQGTTLNSVTRFSLPLRHLDRVVSRGKRRQQRIDHDPPERAGRILALADLRGH